MHTLESTLPVLLDAIRGALDRFGVSEIDGR
jgi:hypothetical protein